METTIDLAADKAIVDDLKYHQDLYKAPAVYSRMHKETYKLEKQYDRERRSNVTLTSMN